MIRPRWYHQPQQRKNHRRRVNSVATVEDRPSISSTTATASSFPQRSAAKSKLRNKEDVQAIKQLNNNTQNCLSQQLKKGKEGLNVPLTTAVCVKQGRRGCCSNSKYNKWDKSYANEIATAQAEVNNLSAKYNNKRCKFLLRIVLLLYKKYLIENKSILTNDRT